MNVHYNGSIGSYVAIINNKIVTLNSLNFADAIVEARAISKN